MITVLRGCEQTLSQYDHARSAGIADVHPNAREQGIGGARH
jgi:hypothetical protein